MNIKGITFKYGATIMILFLAVLLPLIYTLDHLFIAFYVNQKQEEIDHFATKYANKIFDIEDEKTYRTFEMSLEIINADLFVFNRDGKILKGTEVLGFKEGTQVMNDIFHPISNKHGVGMKYSEEKGEQSYLLSGKPIIIGNNVNGGLVVVSSMDEVNASIKQVRIWLFVSVIGALIVAIGFTFFISRKLSYPLLQMERATRELAKGKLRTKLSFQTKDEVGSLSTAIMDLERELEDYRTNRREFFANISHELRTPISYIKGYSMVLRDELYKNEKEKNQYLTIIHDESTRLTDLINDLFELAKMEEGKLDLNYARTDISDIINSSVRKINLKAKEKGIRITLNTPSDHTLLYTDGRRLEQIFINLLENAIQYSEPHSNIDVSTKVQKRDIQVLIKDSGIGIPKEDLPYIFERFYRVEKSRSRTTGGTGLGLSIVKNLVELLGGRIEITSSVGSGTTFKIYFPTSKEVSEKE
ncbi:sensor histidine kinase [Bacillus capparidis]|uniref:histidine kinase n=1 Tax=Bacillus capparidis TaxID=1840411 RepID=A0ABS4CRQ3_9BACI|nr:HAMP domain-containing sensor histidine kinase [Bacillus capparidis]MBP1080206.1 signal transduction histidine kinase [Bacillus capparidis]MED1094078.1 HAMP domain-containing sensor histidine kinase [Bacillus capparidis]